MSELEEKLQNLHIWPRQDDDNYNIDDVIQLVNEHQHLNHEFNILIDLLSNCSRDIDSSCALYTKSTTDLIEGLYDLATLLGTDKEFLLKATMDFFALVGGVKLTWKLYEKALDTLNQSCVSEMAIVVRDNDRLDVKTVKRLLEKLRHIWVNATDESETFAVRLGKAGILPRLAEEIDFMYKNKGMVSLCIFLYSIF